ncbi:unnamed protein product [Ectocarpus sp. CCAP 1310/34]|nr:unnamed protein product [Ectocarpus sp. CCAP 1310/34]
MSESMESFTAAAVTNESHHVDVGEDVEGGLGGLGEVGPEVGSPSPLCGSGSGGGEVGAASSPAPASAADGPAASPRGAILPTSPEDLATLQGEVENLLFPNLEQGSQQQFGEATIENAVGMLKAKIGRGYPLQRHNKTKLYTRKQEAEHGRRNRWNYVEIVCPQAGSPRARERVANASARRNTSSEKIGCAFEVGLWWAANSPAPIVAKGKLCLTHHTKTSGGKEHERPRAIENEMSVAEIEAKRDFLRELHASRVKTTEIHKTLERVGKRLGQAGKQKVRTMMAQFDAERQAENGAFNDAQLLVGHLQNTEAFLRFKHEDGRMTCIAWASQDQKVLAMRYHKIIIQDNTFNTNVYKFFLALIVVVDKENHTQIAMQALLANERSESFEFIFESFKELCGGGSPGVVFTDCDSAAMLAIANVYPSALNKLCIWHTMENIRDHGRGLAEGVLPAVLGKFKAAAYAQTQEYFLQLRGEILDMLPPESHMYKYMAVNIFGAERAGKWASYVHPGLHTLGIASTQRVESMNAAVKAVVTRKGSMMDLNDGIMAKVQDGMAKTERRSTGGKVNKVSMRQAKSAMSRVTTSHVDQFRFILDALAHEKSSTHAMEDTEAQIVAALTYQDRTVVSDADAARRLLDDLVADPAQAKLVYDTRSGELVDPSHETPDASGITMVSRTSVPHFADLLRGQNVDAVVRISKITPPSEFGHLVAVGSDGFFLCTCLRQLVYGLLCPHVIKALWSQRITRFNGASIGPWWRDSSTPWTMEALAARPARLSTGAAGAHGQVPPLVGNPDAIGSLDSGPKLSAYGYANGLSLGKELGALFKEVGSVAGIHRVVDTVFNFARQQVEVEKRSLRQESRGRVFTGTFSQPTTVTGRGGASSRGGRGSTGTGRGDRGGGRGRGRGAGRGGGESVGLATGTSSPVSGVPTVQNPVAAGAVPAPSVLQTPANGAHTFQGLGTPLRSLNNVDFGGGGQARSPPQEPAHLMHMEHLHPPLAQKQTGQSKRHKRGGC